VKENRDTPLHPGYPFPQLTTTTVGGQTLTLLDAFAGDFGVVLFCRGAWCPYCNAQLRTFERAGQMLADNGIRVAALSVDDKETSAAPGRQAQADLPPRLRRRRPRRGRADRRVRQPRAGVPAVHWLRPRPRG
jgi:thiol-disulfide isomerase/thioredoxin